MNSEHFDNKDCKNIKLTKQVFLVFCIIFHESLRRMQNSEYELIWRKSS